LTDNGSLKISINNAQTTNKFQILIFEINYSPTSGLKLVGMEKASKRES
jgi:hypothetical protein